MKMSRISTRLLSLLLSAAPVAALAQHAGHDTTETNTEQAVQAPVNQKPASETAFVNADELTSERGPHGGVVVGEEGLRAEIVVDQTGIKLFLLESASIESKGLHATAVMKIAGEPSQRRFDLLPQPSAKDAPPLLAARYDLSLYGGQTAEIAVEGLLRQSITRSLPKLVASVQLPRTPEQSRAAAIAEQKVCPVSGEPLGSMGDPIAVAVGDREVYVCCQGCVAAVQAEPAKYLAMVDASPGSVPAGDEEVRPGAFKVTAADQPFIAAQKTCPVMQEPLGEMGEPYKVHADGKAIYICCPGCAKKIAAAPAKYLHDLAEQGVTPPTLQPQGAGDAVAAASEEVRPGVFKVTAADRPFVEAQKLCPVMDEPLGGMGDPYRVDVEGHAVYICCPGCAKKLQADPQVYLQKLAAQGIEPPAVR